LARSDYDPETPMAAHEGYSPRNLAERAIAAGRLFLALLLALAIWIDPTEPPPYAPLVRQLSTGYLVYAIGVALLAWFRRVSTGLLPPATHAVDLVMFGLLVHVTDSAASPFFVYFVFATLAGAIRWHGPGALFTGTTALAVYVATSLADLPFRRQGEFEVTRFVARCTELAVVTGMVAYLATYYRRLQREIEGLAAWPRRVSTAEEEATEQILAYAAGMLRVERVVLAWEEGDEPALRLAARTGRGTEITREPPGAFDPLVAPPLARSSFVCTDLGAASPRVLHRVPGGFAVWRGAPLDARFRGRFRIDSVIAVRLAAGTIQGWLFALDRRRASTEDVLLGDIVARLVTGTLELNAALGQLRDAARSEERLRLARELHDGVLQSLTAASLQARRVRQIVASDPEEAVRRLATLDDMILGEQQALRLAISQRRDGAETGTVDCGGLVREAAMRVADEWEVRVRLDLQPSLPEVPRRTAHEIVRMVQEALVNAVRHGRARDVLLTLSLSEGRLRLEVGYEGRGFQGFTGRHDLAALDAMKAGPRTLKERVSALGGSMVIDSTEAGARVEIAVPLYAETQNATGS
jgi:signal transduction histidine kinase